MKKPVSIFASVVLIATVFAGCVGGNGGSGSFDTSREISVITREEGSGTRGAFVELFGIQEKSDGRTSDKTTKEAITAPKTDVMLTNVSGDPYAVGYVSLGSLNNSIKVLDIDGVKATVDNVKNGEYTISRPFNIGTQEVVSDVTMDFIEFILSKDGQKVVSDNGYIAVNDSTSSYSGDRLEGKIVVAGSSSVSPVMEKLKEAYLAVNTNASIEIQMSDSTTGMQTAIAGTCDIGMVSRELKDSEKETLIETRIAIDGIAVITNKANALEGLTKEQVKEVFTGKITTWLEL